MSDIVIVGAGIAGATLAAELDLQREGANASVLRRFWAQSSDLYVPAPVWERTAQRVLTLERVEAAFASHVMEIDGHTLATTEHHATEHADRHQHALQADDGVHAPRDAR